MPLYRSALRIQGQNRVSLIVSVVKYDKNENDAKNYENILQIQTRLTSPQNVKLPSNFSCTKGKEAMGTICIHFSNSESFHTLNESILFSTNIIHDKHSNLKQQEFG